MPRREYAPVTGSKIPGYAILEEDDDRVNVQFVGDDGQPYAEHVHAETVDDAKKRAADVCREKIAMTSDGPSDLHHWFKIPTDAANAVEYALGHAKRHPDDNELA